MAEPTFIHIGAQKCATTWWYQCAGQHPSIYLGPKNVIRYFEYPRYRERDWDWYLGQFEGAEPGQLAGEARVEYLFTPETPRLIARHLPRCKLIVHLRDPVERAVSAHLHNYRRGIVDEADLDKGLRKSLEHFHNKPHSDSKSEAYSNVIGMGLYFQQLTRYLEHFDLSQLLIIPYESIKGNPAGCMRASFRFLEVDDFQPSGLKRQPLKSAGLGWMTALERATRSIHGTSKVWDWFNRAAVKSGIQSRSPRLRSSTRKELMAFYGPANRQLAELLRNHFEHPETVSEHFPRSWPRWMEGRP